MRAAALIVAALVLSAGESVDAPLHSARAPVRLVAVPRTLAGACRGVGLRSSVRVLCPAQLPRATVAWPPGTFPPALVATIIPSADPRHPREPLGLDIGYGAPWESDPPFVTETEIRPHIWRNRPCCFLHVDVERVLPRRMPSGARPAVVGGVRGRLLPASGKYFGGPYFGNHVRFFFERGGVMYVATLHTFGERETEALLGRIVHTLGEPGPRRRPRGVYVGVGTTALVSTAGALWAASLGGLGRRGALTRIDAATGRVLATVHPHLRPLDVVAARGSLWVAGYAGGGATVVRVDRRSSAVTARVATGKWPRALAFGPHGLWVVNSAPFARRGSLVRVDPSTNRVTGRLTPLGRAPARVAVDARNAWVTDALDGTLTRVDLRSRRVVARIRTGRDPWGVAVGAGAVWVTNVDDGTVTRVDPARSRVVATIRAGRNPYGIVVGADAVWVANAGDGTVTRIDPHTNRARVWRRVGGDPIALAVAHGAVWVTLNSDGTVRRLPLG